MNRLAAVLIATLGFCAMVAAQTLLTPAQFTQEYAQALRKTDSSLRVEIVEDLQLKVTSKDDREFTKFLDNAYNTYKQEPADKKNVIARYITAGMETIGEQDAAIDKTRIVPVVKDRGWLQSTRQAMIDRGAKKIPEALYEEMNSELIVLYAVDSRHNIRYLSMQDLKDLKIEKSTLRKMAVDNLKKLLPDIKRYGGDGVYMLAAGGDYEVSLLVMDTIWTRGNFDVKGDIVVAVPNRDMLLVTGSEDEAGLKKVRDIARKSYEEGSYRLTTKLFVYRQGQFNELKSP